MKQSRRKALDQGVQQPPGIRIRIGHLQWPGDRPGAAEALRAGLESKLLSEFHQVLPEGQANINELPERAADAIMARVNAALKQRGKT